MQIVNGFHGKNIVKDDQRISEEKYSDGIDEGQTQINIVKHSQVQDVSEIFKAAKVLDREELVAHLNYVLALQNSEEEFKYEEAKHNRSAVRNQGLVVNNIQYRSNA